MQSPEEFARENIDALLKDWSSSDKTSSEGEARRVSAGSANQFQQFVTPDDGRKFTELYNVQHLQSAQLDRVSRVCISTIQRLYSMLRSFFFWIETPIPQDQFTRGDRQRFVRDDANGNNVYNIDTEISVPMVFPVECEPFCR